MFLIVVIVNVGVIRVVIVGGALGTELDDGIELLESGGMDSELGRERLMLPLLLVV
jgi:hypothetical protein